MSIWSDIQDRSAGITKRKEDEIEDSTPYMFCGVVDSIANLPQNAKQGSIYVIENPGQTVIFWNNIWASVETQDITGLNQLNKLENE